MVSNCTQWIRKWKTKKTKLHLQHFTNSYDKLFFMLERHYLFVGVNKMLSVSYMHASSTSQPSSQKGKKSFLTFSNTENCFICFWRWKWSSFISFFHFRWEKETRQVSFAPEKVTWTNKNFWNSKNFSVVFRLSWKEKLFSFFLFFFCWFMLLHLRA